MPVISVDAERADLDGLVVAERSLLVGEQEAALPRLVEELRMLRRNFGLLHPGEKPGDEVLIRAEGGVPYRVLRRLIAASAEAGYRGVSFAVERGR
jgi:biopolymer transport protein ExbD